MTAPQQSFASHSEEEKCQQKGYDARAHGPEDVPSIPTRLEVLPRMLSCRLVHRTGIQLPKRVVQRNVDRDSRQLHAEKVNERGDDDEQALSSTQCPNAKHS